MGFAKAKTRAKKKSKTIWIKGFVKGRMIGKTGGVTLLVWDDAACRERGIPRSCFKTHRKLDNELYCCIELYFMGQLLRVADKFKALEPEQLQRLLNNGTVA